MRVGVLADFTFEQRPGGAARAMDRWIANFPDDPNLEMVLCPHGQVDRECDAYVLMLTKLYTHDELGFITTKPFVRYEFDYWYEKEPQSPWRDPLNRAAKLIMFPSYLHRRVYQYKYHVDLMDKSVILPPPLDVGDYIEYKTRWDDLGRNNAIWYGEWHWLKGPDIAMKWALHNETQLDMYSPSMPPDQASPHKFVNICGFAPEERWLDIIAQHAKFVHLPREPQCFPYSMIEAYLLGCEVIVSGRIGVESYFEDGITTIDEVVDQCVDSNTRFWKIALGALL